MKNVWKLLCLLAIIALVVVTAVAYTVFSQAFLAKILGPIVSVCLGIVAGYILGINRTVFTKRHTTATGVG